MLVRTLARIAAIVVVIWLVIAATFSWWAALLAQLFPITWRALPWRWLHFPWVHP